MKQNCWSDQAGARYNRLSFKTNAIQSIKRFGRNKLVRKGIEETTKGEHLSIFFSLKGKEDVNHDNWAE